MKITLKRTPKQIELIKAMASRDKNVAWDAQVALAQFIGPVLAQVINNAPTLSNMFSQIQFDENDNPSIPLDLYYDVTDEKYIRVYSTQVAGGLPTNQVLPTVSEMKIHTYTLDSALSFDRRYAAKSRMDVVGKTFTRMAQEILLQQERTSANLVLGSLADAVTNSKDHVRTANTANRFLIEDLNLLFNLAKRINTSWSAGTPTARGSRGLTDLLVSPEVVAELRRIAYNPINTQGNPVGGATPADGIPATDEVRNSVFNNAGIPEFFGVNIMEFNELGAGQSFNTIFETVAGGAGASTTAATFTDGSLQEIIVGLDRTRDSMLRAVAVDGVSSSEFNLEPSDEYNRRQKKIGWFGDLEEGRMVLDDRALLGVICSGLPTV